MQLDVFTHLKDRPLTADATAASLGVKSEKLRPLLYALVAAGLLVANGELFSNTPETQHYLVRGSSYFRGSRMARRWEAILKTAETIRTGVPQAKVDYSAFTQVELENFYRGGHAETLRAGRYLVNHYDFTSYHSLVDVAGGSGGMAIAIAQACPNLYATVIELPNSTSIAECMVKESDVAGRMHVAAADVVEGPMTDSFDVAVTRSLIQVLSPDQARRAIKNIGQVIKDAGDLYILGNVLDNSRVSPLETVVQNLNLLSSYNDGQAYTEQEHRDWMTEAGFVDIQREVLNNGHSIMTGKKSE